MSASSPGHDARPAAEREEIFLRLFQRSRPFLLLAALLIKILLAAVEDPHAILPLVLRGVVVAAAVVVAADTRRHLAIGLSLGIPALVMLVIADGTDSHAVGLATYLVTLMLYLYIIRLMLMKIFQQPVVTLDTIGLALCCYVLLGQVWMLFYAPVVDADPGAFTVPISLEAPESLLTLTYFSYVTLTTLGYGDISPVSPLARSLAVLEALTGTLFLAVLISRLVGTYRRQREDEAG